ncbi:MAG TPA: hypothetical protein VKB80_10170 [Kofleriaceae bacterium]|nr:hypothetical protein [Kofleriaceae bacterium]
MNDRIRAAGVRELDQPEPERLPIEPRQAARGPVAVHLKRAVIPKLGIPQPDRLARPIIMPPDDLPYPLPARPGTDGSRLGHPAIVAPAVRAPVAAIRVTTVAGVAAGIAGPVIVAGPIIGVHPVHGSARGTAGPGHRQEEDLNEGRGPRASSHAAGL